MKYPKSFLLFIAGTLPFMILIVSGLTLYFSNRDEISFTFVDIVLPLAASFLAASLILYLVLWLFLRFRNLPGITAGLLTGMAVAVWVQSQLLVWKFGQFDGQLIDWGSWKNSMYIDGALWVAIITVSLFIFIRGKQKIAEVLVLAVYLAGTVSILITLLRAPEKTESRADESAYKEIFSFHPKNNVLIILLDDFQSDYFNHIANTFPGEISELDGFTFYRNTTTRFPTTKASLPSIITGKLYRNEEKYADYITHAYKEFNLFQAYRDRSFNTCFVGQLQNLFPDVISMENVANRMSNVHFYKFFRYLDYGFFRALPTFAKPVIYNRGNWFFIYRLRQQYPPEYHGGDIRFLELIERNVSVRSAGKGSLKFFHFFIPHAPWRVNENLKFDPGLTGDSGYIRQTRGAVRLVSRILKTLKKAGIYELTEIVILSDHGTGNQGIANPRNIYDETVSLVPGSVQSSSMALLLHKPAKSKGNLRVSDVPLELTDLACLLGLHDGDTLGREFRKAISGQERLRTFYYYQWGQEYWSNNYLPPMTEYCISGNSYSRESYSAGKSVFTSEGITPIPARPAPSYKLGRKITFSTKGNGESDPFIRGGWSLSEASQRWTDGPLAGLSFKLEEPPRKDVVLRILALGYVAHDKIRAQVVTVVVNRVPVGRLLVKEGGWYEAVIPVSLIQGNRVNIVFKISDPMAPSSVEKIQDNRKLGLGIAQLIMEEIK
jgi:hypothetical protein